MWTSLTTIALGLSCASQISLAASSAHYPRQEQCASAPNDAAYAACAMQAAFGGSSIVPELLPSFSPLAALSIKYGNVVLGGAQQLSPARVFAQPSLSMSFASNSTQAIQRSYVVVGLNYQPTNSVRLFWLQSALTVDSTTGALTSSIAPIVAYTSPNPLQGTGTHEYIFFVFQDPGLAAIVKQNPQLIPSSTGAFDFDAFLSKATVAAVPIAGSYFKSTYDGVLINGQTPAALAATQSQARQVTSSTNQTTVVTNHTQTTNSTTPPGAVAVKSTAAVPTQIVGAATNTTASSSNATIPSDSTSPATTMISGNSLKLLTLAALVTTFFV